MPLSAKNIICLDNESFRYLVLIKNSDNNENELVLQEIKQQHETFMKSWEISKQASEKMIMYACEDLPVLNTKEVVCFNQSRNISKILDVIIKKIAAKKLSLRNRDLQNHNDQINRLLTDVISRLQSSQSNNLEIAEYLEQIRSIHNQKALEIKQENVLSHELEKELNVLSNILQNELVHIDLRASE